MLNMRRKQRRQKLTSTPLYRDSNKFTCNGREKRKTCTFAAMTLLAEDAVSATFTIVAASLSAPNIQPVHSEMHIRQSATSETLSAVLFLQIGVEVLHVKFETQYASITSADIK
jgi:hypothetical protein